MKKNYYYPDLNELSTFVAELPSDLESKFKILKYHLSRINRNGIMNYDDILVSDNDIKGILEQINIKYISICDVFENNGKEIKCEEVIFESMPNLFKLVHFSEWQGIDISYNACVVHDFHKSESTGKYHLEFKFIDDAPFTRNKNLEILIG